MAHCRSFPGIQMMNLYHRLPPRRASALHRSSLTQCQPSYLLACATASGPLLDDVACKAKAGLNSILYFSCNCSRTRACATTSFNAQLWAGSQGENTAFLCFEFELLLDRRTSSVGSAFFILIFQHQLPITQGPICCFTYLYVCLSAFVYINRRFKEPACYFYIRFAVVLSHNKRDSSMSGLMKSTEGLKMNLKTPLRTFMGSVHFSNTPSTCRKYLRK